MEGVTLGVPAAGPPGEGVPEDVPLGDAPGEPVGVPVPAPAPEVVGVGEGVGVASGVAPPAVTVGEAVPEGEGVAAGDAPPTVPEGEAVSEEEGEAAGDVPADPVSEAVPVGVGVAVPEGVRVAATPPLALVVCVGLLEPEGVGLEVPEGLRTAPFAVAEGEGDTGAAIKEIRRMRWLPVSPTKINAEAESTAKADGELKDAEVAAPSAHAGRPSPASVVTVTTPWTVTNLRMRLLVVSATYTLPEVSRLTVTPLGSLNIALVPVPSKNPELPFPAKVFTTIPTPVLPDEILRMRLFRVSAT